MSKEQFHIPKDLLSPQSLGALGRPAQNSYTADPYDLAREFIAKANHNNAIASAGLSNTWSDLLEREAKAKNLNLGEAIEVASIETAVDCLFYALNKNMAAMQVLERSEKIVRAQPATFSMQLYAWYKQIDTKFPEIEEYFNELGLASKETVPLRLELSKNRAINDQEALAELIFEAAALGKLDKFLERNPKVLKLVDDLSSDISKLLLSTLQRELVATKYVFKALVEIAYIIHECNQKMLVKEFNPEANAAMDLKYLGTNLFLSSVYSASVHKILKGLPENYSKSELLSNLKKIADFDASEHKSLKKQVPNFNDAFQAFSTTIFSTCCMRAVELQQGLEGALKLGASLTSELEFIRDFTIRSPKTFGVATSTYDGEFVVVYQKPDQKTLLVGVNTIEKVSWISVGEGDLSVAVSSHFIPISRKREFFIGNSATLFFDQNNDAMLGAFQRLQPSSIVPGSATDKEQAHEIVNTAREHIARLAGRFPAIFRSARWVSPVLLMLSENQAKIVIPESLRELLPQSGITAASDRTHIPGCLVYPRSAKFVSFVLPQIMQQETVGKKSATIPIESRLTANALKPLVLADLLPGCTLELKYTDADRGIYFTRSNNIGAKAYIKPVKLSPSLLKSPLNAAQLKILLAELEVDEDLLVESANLRSKNYAIQAVVMLPEFRDWLSSLAPQLEGVVLSRLRRFAQGNVGAWDNVGPNGLDEAIIDSGPGLRIYYATDKRNGFHLVLGGGYKRSQLSDIPKAEALYQSIRANKFGAWE